MNRVYLSLLTATIMVACTQREDNPRAEQANMSIDVALQGVDARAIVTGSNFPSGSSIAVILKNVSSTEIDYSGTAGDGGKNGNGTKTVFTLGGTTWTTSPDVTLTAQRAKVSAYAPSTLTSEINANYTIITPTIIPSKAMGSWTALTKLTINGKTMRLDVGEVDYMTGTGTNVSATTTFSDIKMSHSMAMVGIKLIKSPTYAKAAALTSLSVANKAPSTTLRSGTVSMSNGEFVRSDSESAVVGYTRQMTGYTLGEYVSFLAFPAVVYDNELVELKMTVDGVEYTTTLPGVMDGSKNWKAGNCILYDVTINGVAITVTGVAITKWEKSTEVDEEIPF